MSAVKLFKLKASSIHHNVFNELVMFIDSVESPIIRDISTIDMTKIVPARILYKKELTISCYIEGNNYYSLIREEQV